MIISRLAGGMGNQMFQYALGRSLAIKNDTTLGLDLSYLLDRTPITGFTFRDYALDVFTIEATIVAQQDVPVLHRKYRLGWAMRYIDFIRRKCIPARGKEKSHRFDPAVFSLGPNTYLEGWWQSEKYFKEIRTTLLEDFSLKMPLSDGAKKIQQTIQQSAAPVAVHIRRDDYVNNKILSPCSPEYYQQAMEEIKKQVPQATFFMFCEFAQDAEWIKATIPGSDTYTIVQGLKGYEDMALMSLCNHNIIANSTFSWWSAWLNKHDDKIVIAPKQWFSTGTIDSSDIIPETWIKI